jgi:5'-nucleotidase
MRIVLTNDDGIDAPGLAALERAVSGLAETVVIAPRQEWSGCGHRVTTGAAVRVVELGRGRWVVDGTPGDCVRLALHTLARDADWIVSGINAGGNLGADVVHSGTVAAAREAVLHGRQAVAVSHYIRRGHRIDWEAAHRRARGVLRELLASPLPPGRLWNVNLPSLAPGDAEPGPVRCPTDPSPLPLAFVQRDGGHAYCGDYHGRARRPGMDVDQCFSGRIAVSEVGLW